MWRGELSGGKGLIATGYAEDIGEKAGNLAMNEEAIPHK